RKSRTPPGCVGGPSTRCEPAVPSRSSIPGRPSSACARSTAGGRKGDSKVTSNPKSDIDYRTVDRLVLRTLTPPGRRYWTLVALLMAMVAAGLSTWMFQVWTGLGVTGLRQPVMWATYITNFVFWVGIAHSGTLISAILYLFRTRWRTPVYRAAETMT